MGRERERSVTIKKIYEYIIIRGNITTFTKCFSSVSLVNAYSACSELLACSLLVREEVLLAGLCEGKILFLAGNSVHVNSAHMRGLASTSQPAAPAEQANWHERSDDPRYPPGHGPPLSRICTVHQQRHIKQVHAAPAGRPAPTSWGPGTTGGAPI